MHVNKGWASVCRDEDNQIYLNYNCVAKQWRLEFGAVIGNILGEAILGIVARSAPLSPAASLLDSHKYIK